MLDFSIYDLCVGIDLEMLFRWLIFFRVFVFNRRKNKICTSTKTWISNLYKNFCTNTFWHLFRKRTLKCLLIRRPEPKLFKFWSSARFLWWQNTKRYSSIACLICSISSWYILLVLEWYLKKTYWEFLIIAYTRYYFCWMSHEKGIMIISWERLLLLHIYP